MNEKLKNIIIKKINSDLSEFNAFEDLENEKIWVINRSNHFWYLIYEIRTNILWYRWDFFDHYFYLFSIEDYEIKEIFKEWFSDVVCSDHINSVTYILPVDLEYEYEIDFILGDVDNFKIII